MESENSYGPIKAHMMVTFTKIIFMEKVNTFGLTEESIKEVGSTIKWKDQELSHGVTEDATSVNIKMIKSMGKEHLSGQMVENTSVNGTKANNTEMEFI